MSRPIILFGLDGATFTVLDDLVRRGVMPFLGEFIQTGARGTLKSTIPPLTPPAWTTFVTGRSPGHHGIFNFYQYEDAVSSCPRIVTSRQVRCETLWSIVSRASKRCGSLNFVAHSPAPKVNGTIVPGWVPWRWVKKHSHPEGVIDLFQNEIPGFDLRELAMDFKEEEKAVAGNELEDYDGWIDVHVRREKQWFRCLKHLLTEDRPDLLGIVFDGVDKLQHLLWQFLDPACQPDHPSEQFLSTRSRCWEYFSFVDGFLKETVKLAGKDAMVLIASDHGFTGTTEIVYINSWLADQGYLAWSDRATPESRASQGLGAAHPYHLTHMDPEKTKAFASSASNNGIHISVAGVRGEHGIDPGEYESFRDELSRKLLTECVDPESNEPLVTRVWTRDEVFSGPQMQLAPDLTLELRDGGFFSVLRSDVVVKPRVAVMGCHHPDGVLIARGNGIRAGTTLSPTHLLDIAPTALYALGVPIPEDLEGTVIQEMFTQEFRNDAPVEFGPATTAVDESTSTHPADFADEESEAQVLMRLKALGYIE